jgi:hypothetical protein
MKRNNLWIVLLLVAVALLATACAQAVADAPAKEQPALIEKIEGTELNRVTLTEKAAARLDIQTAPASEETVNGATQTVVPYSSIIYDLEGNTWVYIAQGPLSFVRQQITVDRIEGDLALVSDGLDLGTEVATVGVAELYGADTGIGK